MTLADIRTIEALADAAMRAGHHETATKGYALALRLRVELGYLEDGWFTEAVARGVA